MSHQANFLGEYQEAVDFARAARHGSGTSATRTTKAMYAAMEARALASIGDKRACRRMMREAESSFNQSSPEDDPDWIRYFDAAELQDELAHCFTALRAPREAERHANLSLADDSDAHPRSRTFCRISLATSYLDSKEVAHACETATDAIETAGRIKSARVRQYILNFDRRLDDFGRVRAVADFRERARFLLDVAS